MKNRRKLLTIDDNFRVMQRLGRAFKQYMEGGRGLKLVFFRPYSLVLDTAFAICCA